MKRLFSLVVSVLALVMSSCGYDDTAVWNKVNSLEGRIASLEELCTKTNSDIEALQTIIEALQKNDSVTSVSPIIEDGETIGYTISFSKSGDVTIYNGKDGADGKDGEDGKDGINGDGSYIPSFGVKKDADGVYYWTLDGEWLLDENGNKVSAQGTAGEDGAQGATGATGQPGKDGVTPQLRIEGGFWQVSYDNGATWKDLGRATSDGGGSSIFSDVYEKDGYIYFILSDGESFKLPTSVAGAALDIKFNVEQGVAIVPGTTLKVEYTITGATGKTWVRTLGGFEDEYLPVAKPTDYNHGYIYIHMPDYFGDDDYEAIKDEKIEESIYGDTTYEDYLNSMLSVIVTVSDSKGNQVAKALNFDKGVLKSVEDAYITDSVAGTLSVTITTNTNEGSFEVVIPNKAQSWLSYNVTRAELREDTLVFSVTENTGDKFRSANVNLVNDMGQIGESFVIVQRSNIANETVVFEDPRVEAICVARYDVNLDGKLTYEEIATVTDVRDLFLLEKKIVSFDEFEYFTSVTAIPYEMFADCTLLESVKLPESVTIVGSYAFQNCQSLKSIVIPEGVTCRSQGDYDDESYSSSWFEGCSSLENVTLPSTLDRLPTSCFEDCTSLKSITIPEGINTIPHSCFMGCEQLSTINITTPINHIGGYAFSGCRMLTSFDLSHLGEIKTDNYDYEYDYLGYNAFSNSGLTSVVIPETVKYISNYTFYECVDLTSVTLHDDIRTIAECAFSGCSNLKSVKLPLNLETIGYNAFRNSGLEGEEIEGTSMKAVVIPAKVTSIGYYAFDGCSSLSAVKMLPMYPPQQDGSFSKTTTIYVHPDVVEDYKTTSYWSNYTILPYDMMSINLSTDMEFAGEPTYYDGAFNFPVSVCVDGDIATAENVEEFGYFVKMPKNYYNNDIWYYPVEELGVEVDQTISINGEYMSVDSANYVASANCEVGAYVRLVDGTYVIYNKHLVEFVYDEKPSFELVGYELTDMSVGSSYTYLYFTAEYEVSGRCWLYDLDLQSDGYVYVQDASWSDEDIYIIRGYWRYYNTDENPVANIWIRYMDFEYCYFDTDSFTLTNEFPDVEAEVAMGSCSEMYGFDVEAEFPSGYWAAIRVKANGNHLKSIKWVYAYTEDIDSLGLSNEEIVTQYGSDASDMISYIKEDGQYFGRINASTGSSLTAVLGITSIFGKTKYYRVDYTIPNATELEYAIYQVSEYNEELDDTLITRIRLVGGLYENHVQLEMEVEAGIYVRGYDGVIDQENRTLTFNGDMWQGEDVDTFNRYYFWYDESNSEVFGIWSSSDAEYQNGADLVFTYDENGVITSLNNYWAMFINYSHATDDTYKRTVFSFTPNATIEREGAAQPKAKSKSINSVNSLNLFNSMSLVAPKKVVR